MTTISNMVPHMSGPINPSMFFPYIPRQLLLVGEMQQSMANHSKIVQAQRLDDIGDFIGSGFKSDGIVFVPAKWTLALIENTLSQLTKLLDNNGRVVFLFDAAYGLPWDIDAFDRILFDHDMMRYGDHYRYDSPESIASGNITVVRSSYNPVAHARQVAVAGRPDCAIEIIDTIPESLVRHKDLIAGLALEKQQQYLSWQKRSSHDPLHALFSKSRREFAQVTALDPYCLDSYRIHSQYWAHIGRADMARRVERSIRHLFPDIPMVPTSEGKFPLSPPPNNISSVTVWDPRNRAVRILILTHDNSDYGMDTLYHGLCTLLGKENVVEFPWKPTLHGQNVEAANNYPCVFNYPGDPTPVDSLVKELRQGRFDFILYGDVVQMTQGDAIKRIVNANPDIPVVLYDTWDDCYTPLPQILDYIGRKQFDLMFKREMLDGVDYGNRTFALPFGYAEKFILPEPKSDKGDEIFWAGKNEYGLRPLYIKALERRLGRRLDRKFDQATYKSKLAGSKMGLSFFGCGFDSVRYWELPANGVMLLAERPPIRIPCNFIDGQSAVFFDDLPEMESKLDYYTRRPEEVARIAAAGHAHYLKHHTTVMRARQLLGIIDRELSGGLSKTKVPAPSAGKKSFYNVRARTSKVYLGLVKGENYGWGVCSQNLIEELSKFQSVHVLNEKDGSACNGHLGGPLFQALTTVDFPPLFEKARGTYNFGYTFFENELTPSSVINAKKYDLVIAGSSWCRDRMIEKGITNCDILIQGVDPKLFYPIDNASPRDRFVIFSGGKFELRKGQDLVLRAIKILQDKYPDVYLVNCWYNMWPDSVRQMAASPYITFRYNENESWQETMQRTYKDNGLDLERVVTLDHIPHQDQRALFEQTDIGVFPNRCEGGTNLVLMEYMACAKPVIASYSSGHKDILTKNNAMPLYQLKRINIVDNDGALIGRWRDPSLEELVARLEYAYLHRDSLKTIARQAGEDLRRFTWRRSARKLAQILDR